MADKILQSEYGSISWNSSKTQLILSSYTGALRHTFTDTPITIEIKNDFTIDNSSGDDYDILARESADEFSTLLTSWSYGGFYSVVSPKAGETWIFEDGVKPKKYVVPTLTIKKDEYSSIATSPGHNDWVVINDYSVSGVLDTKAPISIEINSDVDITPWNGTLSVTIHSGSTDYKWNLTGQGSNVINVKDGETWLFEDGSEPKRTAEAKRGELKIGGKIVKSISIGGKNVKSLTLNGKVVTL